MADPLVSWPRPHFESGGGTPLLFYVVFGKFDLALPLSRSKYRASGLPEWLELVNCRRAAHPEVFRRYQGGEIWEMLRRDVPITAHEAEQAPECAVIRGEPEDPSTLDYFREAIGIITWLLDAGGTAVYDPQMLWLWAADEWREEVFEPAEPNPDRHTAILVSEDVGVGEGGSWYHTRGMRKFGRPDLSIRGVGEKHAAAVTELVEWFVEYQALGGVIGEGEAVKMKGLPAGGLCRHEGDEDDPEFNNAHVEIAWPAGALR